MTATATPSPVVPVRSILAAEATALAAGEAFVAEVIAQSEAFSAWRAGFTSDRAAATAAKISPATLSGLAAVVGFVDDVTEAHGDDIAPMLLGGILPGLRGYASTHSRLVREGGEAIARAADPEAAVAAFTQRLEAAKRAKAEARKSKPKAPKVQTVRETLTPVAFLAETLRAAQLVQIDPTTVTDEDCAEIVALAEALAPHLRRIVAAAGGEEAPTLGTLTTV